MIGYISFTTDILIAIVIVLGVVVSIFVIAKVLARMKTKKWGQGTFYD